MATPTLVVVSGPPGAGKTTLAHRLAPLIGCPVVSRDEIKEGMVQATPGYVARPSDDLAIRTYEAFFATLDLLLRRGVTVVAEAAFQDRLWRPRLEPLREHADVRVIQCTVAAETARTRQLGRLASSTTRAAHADADLLREVATAPAFVPLALGVPTLWVDTAEGYRPDLGAVAAFACAPRTSGTDPGASRPTRKP